MIVDHQSHWIPEAAFSLLGPAAERRGDRWWVTFEAGHELSYGAEFFDLATHFADLDRHGVDAILSSPGSAGDLSRMPLEVAVELAEIYNGEAARAQRESGGRFLGLAVVPLQDPDVAVKTLDRALAEHQLKGLCVPPNIDGRPIAEDTLLPVYARLGEAGRPLVIHPTTHTVMSAAYAGFRRELETINWMFDTSAASLALIYGGVLDAVPDLAVLHPHLGGALPYLAARMTAIDSARTADDPRPTRPLLDYFRHNFYVDTVSGTPGSIRMAQHLYGAEKVLFASDYPWLPREPAFQSIRDQLDPDEQRILEHTVLAGIP